ncbi:MAG: hypothetical protein ACKO8G_00655, partial [Actinomycetota bacterium]
MAAPRLRLRAALAALALVLLAAAACSPAPAEGPGPAASAPLRFEDVAASIGLGAYRNGAFRDRVTSDPVATMGTGLCWLDADRDGWLDLFVVNTWAAADLGAWRAAGGPP